MVEEANEGGDDEASVVVERGLEMSVEVESRGGEALEMLA